MTNRHSDLPTDRPNLAPRSYEIRLRGHLDPRWSDWLEGLSVERMPDGSTLLSGPIGDQSALVGVLNRLHQLNLRLISVCEILPGRPLPGKEEKP
jgi:hypothetical protein